MTRSIGVMHGPNLNLLGQREPELYGRRTLDEINQALERQAALAGYALRTIQSNHEGELLDWLQTSGADCAGLLLNPAGLTHSSVALRDTLLALRVPAVEVHITNPAAREPFRQNSLIADVVLAGVRGFGSCGYELALQGLLSLLESRQN